MRLTASALSRAEHCIGSVVLDGIEESGGYADIGSAIDRFVQAAKTGDREKALAAAPADLRGYLSALTIDRIPDGAEYQVAFAYNVLTGEVRRIPGRGHYPDDMPPEWIFGTADIVGMRPGRALVWDLKWGSSTIGRDPADDLQLGFYAMCASRWTGVDECEVAFARAGWDSVLRPESAVLDEMAIDEIQDRIIAIWREADRTGSLHSNGFESPRLHVGPWCSYCPARRQCPAQAVPVALVARGDVLALSGETLAPEVIRERVTALSDGEKGVLWGRLDAVEATLATIRATIRDDARQCPIPIGDGKELRAVMWGARRSSPAARAEEAALEERLRAAGEVATIKVEQVRAMKARR